MQWTCLCSAAFIHAEILQELMFRFEDFCSCGFLLFVFIALWKMQSQDKALQNGSVQLRSFSQNGNNSSLKQFQLLKGQNLFMYFRKLRNWKCRFTECGQRRVEPFFWEAWHLPSLWEANCISFMSSGWSECFSLISWKSSWPAGDGVYWN